MHSLSSTGTPLPSPPSFLMASDASFVTMAHLHLPNNSDLTQPLLTVNLANITKLDSSNYLPWSIQLQALLEGYNLHHYVTSPHVPPPATVVVEETTVPNPTHLTWVRQDRLHFSALLGSITQPLEPLVARATTVLELWETLAHTFAVLSRGHVKQLKEQLRWCSKGSRTVSAFLQDVRMRADALALLGKPINEGDLIDLVLVGLGEEFRLVTISFSELHEKLLNREALLLNASPPLLHFRSLQIRQRLILANSGATKLTTAPTVAHCLQPTVTLRPLCANPDPILVGVRRVALKATAPKDALTSAFFPLL